MAGIRSTRDGFDRGDLSSIAFGLIFLAVGVGIMYMGYTTSYQKVKNVQSTVETTEGTVTTSNVRQFTEPDTEEGGAETEYFPQVKYTYTVDGKTYNGKFIYSRIGRGNTEYGEPVGKEFENHRRARQVIAGYQEGSNVTVYYFPDDPGRAFLVKPAIDWVQTLMMIGFGGIFALTGLLVAVGDTE